MVTSESDEPRRFLRSLIGISLFLMFKTEQCLGDGFADMAWQMSHEFVAGSFDGFELETNVLRHDVDLNGLTYIGRQCIHALLFVTSEFHFGINAFNIILAQSYDSYWDLVWVSHFHIVCFPPDLIRLHLLPPNRWHVLPGRLRCGITSTVAPWLWMVKLCGQPRQVIPTVGSIWPFYMVNESAWFQHRQWHRSSIQFRCRAQATLEALKSGSENAENGMCFSESFNWLRAGKASWQMWDFEMHLMKLIASFASNLTLCSSRLFPLMLSRSVAMAVSPLKNPTPCRAVWYPSSGLCSNVEAAAVIEQIWI